MIIYQQTLSIQQCIQQIIQRRQSSKVLKEVWKILPAQLRAGSRVRVRGHFRRVFSAGRMLHPPPGVEVNKLVQYFLGWGQSRIRLEEEHSFIVKPQDFAEDEALSYGCGSAMKNPSHKIWTCQECLHVHSMLRLHHDATNNNTRVILRIIATTTSQSFIKGLAGLMNNSAESCLLLTTTTGSNSNNHEQER